MAKTSAKSATSFERLALRHALLGWLGLLVFLSLGILLEIFHGMKLDLYLDVRQETRRFMWSLAHAHGTLFSLVQLGFAWSVMFASRWEDRLAPQFRVISWALIGGWIMVPLGFLLGGMWTHGGDPSIGILFVPLGALFLLVAVFRMVIFFATIFRKTQKQKK